MGHCKSFNITQRAGNVTRFHTGMNFGQFFFECGAAQHLAKDLNYEQGFIPKPVSL